jgi:tripartite-type tricarboxylate transporter receptor subunit TctC
MLTHGAAHAQSYPEEPIHIVSPFTPVAAPI